jgi:four helix bundle protein
LHAENAHEFAPVVFGVRGPETGIRGQGSGVGDQRSGNQMKSKIKSYQDLEVWQKAMDLVVMCYQMTTNFPKTEIYGLSSQLQRAAVSVPANIAEGRQRQHSKEFLQHLSIAYGSLAELETHIQIAGRLNYIYENQINKMLGITAEIGKMLNGLRKSIEKKKLS